MSGTTMDTADIGGEMDFLVAALGPSLLGTPWLQWPLWHDVFWKCFQLDLEVNLTGQRARCPSGWPGECCTSVPVEGAPSCRSSGNWMMKQQRHSSPLAWLGAIDELSLHF